MEHDWVIVRTVKNEFEAELIRGMLQENDIDSVIINQRDSSYTVFGDISIYVHKDNYEQAGVLVNAAGENE
jgi:hypothetical protein